MIQRYFDTEAHTPNSKIIPNECVLLSDVHPMSASNGSKLLSQEIFCNLNARYSNQFKGATSRCAHLEKFSQRFSSSSFVIYVTLLHP